MRRNDVLVVFDTKGKPAARRGRKASGLRTEDSGVAEFNCVCAESSWVLSFRRCWREATPRHLLVIPTTPLVRRSTSGHEDDANDEHSQIAGRDPHYRPAGVVEHACWLQKRRRLSGQYKRPGNGAGRHSARLADRSATFFERQYCTHDWRLRERIDRNQFVVFVRAFGTRR
jgi:hypothetical protein